MMVECSLLSEMHFLPCHSQKNESWLKLLANDCSSTLWGITFYFLLCMLLSSNQNEPCGFDSGDREIIGQCFCDGLLALLVMFLEGPELGVIFPLHEVGVPILLVICHNLFRIFFCLCRTLLKIKQFRSLINSNTVWVFLFWNARDRKSFRFQIDFQIRDVSTCSLRLNQ